MTHPYQNIKTIDTGAHNERAEINRSGMEEFSHTSKKLERELKRIEKKIKRSVK